MPCCYVASKIKWKDKYANTNCYSNAREKFLPWFQVLSWANFCSVITVIFYLLVLITVIFIFCLPVNSGQIIK